MSDESNQEHEEVSIVSEKKTKKRKVHGRISDVRRKLNLQSHSAGENCNCRMKCFDKITPESRSIILKEFNMMDSHDKQNAYLSGLISLLPIIRRRPRKPENEAKFHEATYKYRVRAKIDEALQDVQVCRKAFMSLHGIGKKKIEYLVKSLKLDGTIQTDKRGKHHNRPHKLSDECVNNIRNHIKSFPSRNSHYGLKDSKKVYLSEDLNLKKMFSMFLEKCPDKRVSYESYRTIFTKEFNISFGYPRTDTCSTCDENTVKLKALQTEQNKTKNSAELSNIMKKIRKLESEIKLHKLKAATFYNRKRQAKLECRRTLHREAVCLDFAKNLPTPNITTNDVYYKRQLSVFAFNVHVLSTSESIFYLYPETVAKKGSDDVCSMVHHFVYNVLPMNVKELEIFCDSCSGQNKNFTFFRFLHHLVHEEKRFDNIKVTFPIRGHSYLECDKNMGLINQKLNAEVPSDWVQIFQEARIKPSPFQVVSADKKIFRKWTSHLERIYNKKAQFHSRPIREYQVLKEHPALVRYRTSYNGLWETSNIKIPKAKLPKRKEGEFVLPDYSYTGNISL